MKQPLIIGLGRSGAGLHLRALHTASTVPPPVWTGPVTAVEPRPGIAPGPCGADPVVVTRSLDDAAQLLSPDGTVAHVCTPPATRPAVIEALASRGFRDLIVEKPLATDAAALAAVAEVRARHGLRIAVVAHWPSSELAGRLRALIGSGGLGPLARIDVAQHKPRFLRSLRARDGHPTAFDVELPHSLGLVLDLAGPAEATGAQLTDLRCGEAVRPRMGAARLDLLHAGGVRTRVVSDLASPVRERSVTLTFRHGTAVAHFPLGADDDHAQLLVGRRREVFRDDALTAFLRRTYLRFIRTGPEHPSWDDDFALHADVVRLIDQAKRHCESSTGEDTRDTV